MAEQSKIIRRGSNPLNPTDPNTGNINLSQSGNAKLDLDRFSSGSAVSSGLNINDNKSNFLYNLAKLGGSLADQAFEQSQTENYLKGVAAAQSGVAIESLQNNILTRDWQTAGYNDTTSRLLMAKEQSKLLADMKDLRELSPEQFNIELSKRYKDMLPKLGAMSADGREKFLSQMITQQSQNIATHAEEHGKYIVEQQINGINTLLSTNIDSLDNASGTAGYLSQSANVGNQFVESVWNNNNLNTKQKQEMITNALQYAMSKGHTGVYDILRSTKMQDGTSVINNLTLDQQTQLSGLRQRIEDKNSNQVTVDAMNRLALVDSNISNGIDPGVSVNDYLSLLAENNYSGKELTSKLSKYYSNEYKMNSLKHIDDNTVQYLSKWNADVKSKLPISDEDLNNYQTQLKVLHDNKVLSDSQYSSKLEDIYAYKNRDQESAIKEEEKNKKALTEVQSNILGIQNGDISYNKQEESLKYYENITDPNKVGNQAITKGQALQNLYVSGITTGADKHATFAGKEFSKVLVGFQTDPTISNTVNQIIDHAYNASIQGNPKELNDLYKYLSPDASSILDEYMKVNRKGGNELKKDGNLFENKLTRARQLSSDKQEKNIADTTLLKQTNNIANEVFNTISDDITNRSSVGSGLNTLANSTIGHFYTREQTLDLGTNDNILFSKDKSGFDISLINKKRERVGSMIEYDLKNNPTIFQRYADNKKILVNHYVQQEQNGEFNNSIMVDNVNRRGSLFLPGTVDRQVLFSGLPNPLQNEKALSIAMIKMSADHINNDKAVNFTIDYNNLTDTFHVEAYNDKGEPANLIPFDISKKDYVDYMNSNEDELYSLSQSDTKSGLIEGIKSVADTYRNGAEMIGRTFLPNYDYDKFNSESAYQYATSQLDKVENAGGLSLEEAKKRPDYYKLREVPQRDNNGNIIKQIPLVGKSVTTNNAGFRKYLGSLSDWKIGEELPHDLVDKASEYAQKESYEAAKVSVDTQIAVNNIPLNTERYKNAVALNTDLAYLSGPARVATVNKSVIKELSSRGLSGKANVDEDKVYRKIKINGRTDSNQLYVKEMNKAIVKGDYNTALTYLQQTTAFKDTQGNNRARRQHQIYMLRKACGL